MKIFIQVQNQRIFLSHQAIKLTKYTKMKKVRQVMKETEELKSKIETKEMELSKLKSTSQNYVAFITEELDTIETVLRVSFDTKMKATEEIRRLQEIVVSCDDNISRMKLERKAKERERTLANSSAAQDSLSEEIENLRLSLDCHIKAKYKIKYIENTEPVIKKEMKLEDTDMNVDYTDFKVKIEKVFKDPSSRQAGKTVLIRRTDGEVGDYTDFKMKIDKVFKDPLSRQTGKAFMIERTDGKVLRSNLEFNQPELHNVRREIRNG